MIVRLVEVRVGAAARCVVVLDVGGRRCEYGVDVEGGERGGMVVYDAIADDLGPSADLSGPVYAAVLAVHDARVLSLPDLPAGPRR